MLSILGEAEMTASELNRRIRTELDCLPCRTATKTLLDQMVKRGDLERRQDPRTRQPRYVWFRCGELSGPIADLERAFADGEATA